MPGHSFRDSYANAVETAMQLSVDHEIFVSVHNDNDKSAHRLSFSFSFPMILLLHRF